jgi:hypothetical protein
MSSQQNTPLVSFSALLDTMRATPPEIAFLVKGGTGIGKSALAHQLGTDLELDVIDLRLAARTEGDMLGMIDQRALEEDGITCFSPPGWLRRACTKPVILLLDELNRALPSVMNCVFQLIYDRQLSEGRDGLPYQLHPQTRVIVCINEGNEFTGTHEMDPALNRRFATCVLDASFPAWKKWAQGKDKNGNQNVDDLIIEFLTTNTAFWAPDPAKFQSDVFPTPASWHRLSRSLCRSKSEDKTAFDWAPSRNCGTRAPQGVETFTRMMVGNSAGASFLGFVETFKSNVRLDEIMLKPEGWTGTEEEWRKHQRKLVALAKKMKMEEQATLAEGYMGEKNGAEIWLAENRLTPEELFESTKLLLGAIPKELRRSVLQHFTKCLAKAGIPRNQLLPILKESMELMTNESPKAEKNGK